MTARRPTAYATGLAAEDAVCVRLEADGWTVRGRRLRTSAGEIDIVAERNGLLALIEVKARPSLALAANAVSVRQQSRLLAAAELLLRQHPDWGDAGVRFDIIVVDPAGNMRRIADAFRGG